LSVWGRGRVLRHAHAPRFDPAHGRITFCEYVEAKGRDVRRRRRCGQNATRWWRGRTGRRI